MLLGFLAIGSGLGLIRFALPATLLGTRRLARLTRQLTGAWCGVPIAEWYAPPPAGHLTYTERLRWLATDPATRRDLRWAAANLLVCALAAAPVGIIATGLVEFIGPEFTRLIPPPAFPGNTPRTLVVLGLAITSVGVLAAPALLRAYGLVARSILASQGAWPMCLRFRGA